MAFNSQSIAVDFTQGFGTFWFGPTDTVSDCNRQAQTDWRSYPSVNSPSEAPDKRFIPSSFMPFRFMDLPIEIRFKIYRILSASMLGGRNHDLPLMAGKHGIRFKLEDAEWDIPSKFGEGSIPDPMLFTARDIFEINDESEIDGGVIDLTMSEEEEESDESASTNLAGPDIDVVEIWKQINDGTITDSETPSGWLASNPRHGYDRFVETDSESAVETEKDSDDEIEWDYLMRKGNRVKARAWWLQIDRAMSVDSTCYYSVEYGIENHGNQDCNCPHRYREDYENVRTLSHISHHFTRELGESIWANSVLDLSSLDDLTALSKFVRERPMAVKYIKGIIFSIQYYEDGFDTPTSSLADILNCINNNFDLRFITVRFTTETHLLDGSSGPLGDDTITPYLERGKIKEWTPLFRSSKVYEKFDLRVCAVRVDPVNPARRFTYPDLSCDRPALEVQGKLMEMWMPDILRTYRLGGNK
ncbi:hypothetical protein BGZ60DRAFT_406660 [Tricladium varicosporioides]|nr:hypothetical protein BGZ60DRAFT_406660 [Hymenoscyphus varicosporioides]